MSDVWSDAMNGGDWVVVIVLAAVFVAVIAFDGWARRNGKDDR